MTPTIYRLPSGRETRSHTAYLREWTRVGHIVARAFGPEWSLSYCGHGVVIIRSDKRGTLAVDGPVLATIYRLARKAA